MIDKHDEDTYAYTFKSNNPKSKGLDIRILTETTDVTGLSIYLNGEPLDYLNIFKESQPEKVAYEFCVKHQLSYEYLKLMTDQIKSFVNKKHCSDPKKKQESLDDLPESPLDSNKEKRNSSKGQMKYNRPSSTNERQLIKHSPQSESNDLRKTPVLFPSEQYQDHKTQIQASKSSHNYNKPSSTVNHLSKTKTIQASQENDLKDNDIHTQNQIELKKLISSKINPFAGADTIPKLQMDKYLPLNYGERLFHKGVKMQNRTKDKIHSQQEEPSKENRLTFQPVTNPISYNALSKRLINKKSYNDNTTIINYRDHVNKRITDLRQKHNYLEQYSFTPSLDKNSIRIENSKEMNKDKRRYESLYENYKKQQTNKDKLEHQIYNKDILFKPTIREYNCAYSSMSFNDRQGYFLSKSVERKMQTKKTIESNISKETGRPYFHPLINNEYQLTEHRTTFNDLYLDSTQNRNKLKEKEEESNNIFLTLQNSSHINKESNDLFEGMKEKNFKQIFKCLDKNQEGIITHISMNTKGLPKNIAAILSPIFIQLKEENVPLNEKEFTTACFHLFEISSYVQRKELLSFTKKQKTVNSPNQFTFKPTINTDRVERLNKSSQSVVSSNKSAELNMLRQNILQQHYHIQAQIPTQGTEVWTVQNETNPDNNNNANIKEDNKEADA